MSRLHSSQQTQCHTSSSQLELRYLKTLFFRSELRSCITVGEALLEQISGSDKHVFYVHRAYIHFFLALSHDELARQMYDQSKFKITRFEVAEYHYNEAENALGAFQQAEQSFLPTSVKSKHSPPKVASSASRLSFGSTQLSRRSGSSGCHTAGQRFQLRDHIRVMRERISTHITLIQQAKIRVTLYQTKRAAARTATWQQATSPGPLQSPLQSGKMLQPSKSFWLFTPVSMKVTENDNRIEEGRKRGWTRERFAASKYIVLAEDAMAEL